MSSVLLPFSNSNNTRNEEMEEVTVKEEEIEEVEPREISQIKDEHPLRLFMMS